MNESKKNAGELKIDNEVAEVAVKAVAATVTDEKIEAVWVCWLVPRAKARKLYKIDFKERIVASVMKVSYLEAGEPKTTFLTDIYDDKGERMNTFKVDRFGEAQERIRKACPKGLRASLQFRATPFERGNGNEQQTTDLPDVPTGDDVQA